MRVIKFLYILFLKLTNPSCSIYASEVGRNVSLGQKVTLSNGTFIFAKEIGNYSYINRYSIVHKNVKSIGKFCSIAVNCRIGLGGHPTDWVSTHSFVYDKKYSLTFKEKNEYTSKLDLDTIIGHDVWLGANVTILAGVTIGHGAIVGAHSLVTNNVEPYSIVIGTPAKHLKYRHTKENIEILLKSEWWNWEIDELKKRVELFRDIDEFIKFIKENK